MAKKPSVYKVIFHNQGKIFEIYAKSINSSHLLGFIEVETLIFGERSSVVLDPSEEKLKAEFAGVNRTLIPMHAVVRIDEVEKEGVNKIHPASGEGNVMPFPSTSHLPK